MPRREQYKKYEGGIYEGVTRVEFFTTDQRGTPIFKAKDRQGKPELISYYRIFMGEEEGPPGSVTPGNVALLVRGFGGDPALLPAQDDPAFLSTAEQLIAQSDTLVTLYAHKGQGADASAWVRTVYGAELPADHDYLFTFNGVTSRRDGQAIWYEGEYGDYARMDLTVWANGDGSPTHFAGASCTLYVNRPAMTILRALLGTTMEALLGPSEGELAMLDKMATDENGTRVIFATIVMKSNGKGTTIDKTSLQAMKSDGPFPGAASTPATPSPAAPVAPAQPATPVAPLRVAAPPTSSLQSPTMVALRAVIAGGTKVEQDREAYDAGGIITSAGKAWCAKHLKPISKEKGLTNKFSEMDDATCIAYVLGLDRKDILIDMGVLPADDDEEGEWT